MNITIETRGTDQLGMLFEGIAKRAGDLRSPFSEIADDFNVLVRRAFGGDPDFIRTGDVQAALTDAGAEGAVRTLDLDAMVVGTDIWYAVFHRDELLEPITDAVIHGWVKKIRDFILGGRIRGSLFGGFVGL